MTYDKFTVGQRISTLEGRIEGLERQHAERDITITDIRGRLNIATQKKNKAKIEEHSANLNRVVYEQEELEQVIRLLIAERDELAKNVDTVSEE